MQLVLDHYTQNPCSNETSPAKDITGMASKGMTYKRRSFIYLFHLATSLGASSPPYDPRAYVAGGLCDAALKDLEGSE
jgi:hypothetical protein